MGNNRGTILTVAGVIACAAGAFSFLAWPHYQAARSIRADITLLEQRIATSDEQHVSLDALSVRLAAERAAYEHDFREIPLKADPAELIRALSADIDRGRVVDQTLNAGQPAPDPSVEDGSIHILPVTVDMTARFEALYELIARAENLPRLVRVSSVRLERSEEDEDAVVATIGLEAIFEAPAVQQEVK